MSKGPENTFIGSVHKHLPVELYRMKNHNVYNGGIADVWYSGSKCDYWIEYKFIKTPARDATVIDPGLSELQKDWLRNRHAEGRNVGVLVGSKDGGVFFPGVSWDQDFNAAFFRNALHTRKELAQLITSLTCTPARKQST